METRLDVTIAGEGLQNLDLEIMIFSSDFFVFYFTGQHRP
jgi:hypothetical protein